MFESLYATNKQNQFFGLNLHSLLLFNDSRVIDNNCKDEK